MNNNWNEHYLNVAQFITLYKVVHIPNSAGATRIIYFKKAVKQFHMGLFVILYQVRGKCVAIYESCVDQ